MAAWVLSWIISLGLAFALGYSLRSLRDRIKLMMKAMNQILANHKLTPPDPDTGGRVIEPSEDPVEAAKREFEERSRFLNQ